MNKYELIKESEKQFELPIPITENWEWSFKEHVKTTVLYKNSVFKSGPDVNKPFKNITRPILSLQYRAEGFDVKDILLYIEEQDRDAQSFLIRKYHDKWAVENNLDSFIDKLVESYVDFGAALVKKTANSVPEVVPMQRIAFCDQSDMLAGPICEKHFYSPDELRTEAKGKNWENVEEVIALSEKSKQPDKSRKYSTPGKFIEIYELHGVFPRAYLQDDYDSREEYDLVGQVHICALYKTSEGKDAGITLFKGIEKESRYKLILRDEIYGRALGLGGAEELFQDQIWTNYGQIRMKQLLDAASKVLYKTTDVKFANRNKTDNLENGEMLVLGEGKDIQQIDTTPRSTQLFDRFVQDWEIHAQRMGGAAEAMFGNAPPAGTPFKSLELQVAEGHSLHEYRKAKLAVFLSEIYRDWIIPQIVKSIADDEFISELDQNDMEFVGKRLADNLSEKVLREALSKGLLPTEEIRAELKQRIMQKFFDGGNKAFIKLLRKEVKDTKLDVKINIAGKQKDLAGKVDKLVNVARFMLSTYDPNTGTFAVFNDPRMVKLFREIIEASGLNPVDFNSPAAQMNKPPSAESTKPLSELSQRPSVAETVSNQ